MNLDSIRYYIAVILAIPVIIAIIFSIRILGTISSIPAWLGDRINVERVTKQVVYGFVDIDKAHQFREDLMMLMEEHGKNAKFNFEDFDRWGLLRTIDLRREKAKADLRNGEFIISFIGGLITILVGIFVNIQVAGILLAALVLLFSLLVILRVVVTDILSYQSHNVDHESIEMLALMAGWNEKQINHGTSLVMAALLLSFSSSDLGYRIGMRIVDQFGRRSNPLDDKRYRSED